MRMALNEAQKSRGLTSPNPNVGAVIVKQGEILGRGVHRKAGLPHGEREAIADALTRHSADELRGSTIYVTLEPCSTQGRTPACVQGILEMGISSVVYGAVDPNPEHAGRADGILQAQGVEVTAGVLAEQCEYEHRGFFKRMRSGRPWVIAKSAMSLDGKITRPAGEGQWLTGAEARAEVQNIRCESDAIITGGNTVRADDPALTLRGENVLAGKIQPWRVVMTRSDARFLPNSAKLFNDEFSDRTLVYQNESPASVLKQLAEMDCNVVMLECGGVLLGEFVKAGLVDECVFFYAPMICGGSKDGVGDGDMQLVNSLHMKNPQWSQLGNDLMVRGEVNR